METGITLGELITATVGLLAIISFFWATFGKPNSKQNQEIALLKMAMEKDAKEHDDIRRNLGTTEATLNVILTNHLPHIQQELTEVKVILNERLPNKRK